MRILFLCEGNAEAWDSWSGISKSLVDHLRAAGHTVHVRDVDLYGADRWAAAAAAVSLDRRRWATRYHLTAVPFKLRSKQARRHVAARRNQIDMFVPVGSSVDSRGRGRGRPTPPPCLSGAGRSRRAVTSPRAAINST